MMSWYASGGGGYCYLGKKDQACAAAMRRKWPHQVRVVHGGLFNTHSTFHGRLLRQPEPAKAIVAAIRARNTAAKPWRRHRCFSDPSALVCHLWGTDAAVRLEVLREAYARNRRALRRLLAEHNTTFRQIPPLIPLLRQRFRDRGSGSSGPTATPNAGRATPTGTFNLASRVYTSRHVQPLLS